MTDVASSSTIWPPFFDVTTAIILLTIAVRGSRNPTPDDGSLDLVATASYYAPSVAYSIPTSIADKTLDHDEDIAGATSMEGNPRAVATEPRPATGST
ncbi:hypothetical protein SI65_06565 [Aspergillus cristatus]|uniref:Uncharacterized protein n=1 Tax=Aspergillus cristatus TaxID=573508 RepID=A0A1E3BA14_ASPCR|nr:hypothetical protein SI65_06565 [Aspergillus cristatus]